MSDHREYYISKDGEKSGPFTARQLRNKLNKEKLRNSDYVWREGFDNWKPLGDVTSEFPQEQEPPPALPPLIPTTFTITHSNSDLPPTTLEIPAKGVYEPKATLSQKNKLMKLGCTTPELLKNIGRDQASFMIDAWLGDAQAVLQHEIDKRAAANRRTLGIFVCVLLGLGVVGITITWKTSLQQTPAFSGPEPTASSTRYVSSQSNQRPPPRAMRTTTEGQRSSTSSLTSSSPFEPELFEPEAGAVVSLNRDVTIKVGSGAVTLAASRRVTYLRREGDLARIRYAGADYLVPLAAIQPRR